MAYVNPDGKVILLKGVPLDIDYTNTLYFADYSTQVSTLMGYYRQGIYQGEQYMFEKQNYTRRTRGVIEVKTKAEYAMECNYLMFQNTALPKKWFFAFITDVDYINEYNCAIHFVIDVMQTYMFDYTVDDCIIEREHTASDELFENLLPEDVGGGELEWDKVGETHFGSTYSDFEVAVISTEKSTGTGSFEPAEGVAINRCFTGVEVWTHTLNTRSQTALQADLSAINLYIDNFTRNGHKDSIIAIYQYPYNWRNLNGETVDCTPNFATVDGYTPKNKKLFNYPFNYCVVTNNNGGMADFKWERWKYGDESFGSFNVTHTMYPSPRAMAFPRKYRNELGWNAGVTMNSFINCPYSVDAFSDWWALHQNSWTASTYKTGVNMGSFTGSLALSFVSMLPNLAQLKDLENYPAQVIGQTGGDGILYGNQMCEFTMYQCYLKREYAERIDDYFTRYGYNVQRLGKPDPTNRSEWYYVKTQNCTLSITVSATSGMSAKDEKLISDIYNRGITFWRNPENVGDYSLDNVPRD